MGAGAVDKVRDGLPEAGGNAAGRLWQGYRAARKFYAFGIRDLLEIRGPVVLELTRQEKGTAYGRKPEQAERIIG